MEQNERAKKLAEIKSSIELLEECKDKIDNNKKLDEAAKKERKAQIDEAIKENYDKAKLQFQVTKKEIDSAVYNEVSEEYKAKYAERLKKKGLTDDQLHQKEMADVTVVTGEVKKTRTRRHVSSRTKQRDDEKGFDFDPNTERVANEEELMKKSLVKDKKDLERRRHRLTNTMSDKPKNPTTETAIGEVISTKKVNVREEASTSVVIDGVTNNKQNDDKRVIDVSTKESTKYSFDPSSIPNNVSYDVLPLPSNGECYTHKKGRIPVAYLTAADENIIASPNMYRDGKLIDVILERKILDKDIKASELCKGDRDAIVLWLRATGYGVDFPIVARHPDTKKQYPINVKLDTLKYYPFNLKGDINGCFDYVLDNGDVIKFRYLSVAEDAEIRDEIIAKTTELEKFNAVRYIRNLRECISNLDVSEDDKNDLSDCLADMDDIINPNDLEINEDGIYSYSITTQMVKYTYSINGKTDKEFIQSYIENMRAKDAFAYRRFVNDNTPGVNMKISVSVPQSDGGGSFDTFLRIDDYVFGNI